MKTKKQKDEDAGIAMLICLAEKANRLDKNDSLIKGFKKAGVLSNKAYKKLAK